MKSLIINFIAVLYLCSSHAGAWELQHAKSCEGLGLLAEKYTLCFPKRYAVDTVSKDGVFLLWTNTKPIVSFRYSDYKDLLQSDQERGENKYQTKTSIDGETVYVHLLAFTEVESSTHTWTYVVKEGELYMQVIGISETEVHELFSEIMRSKVMR
jgi:hypothetical protein